MDEGETVSLFRTYNLDDEVPDWELKSDAASTRPASEEVADGDGVQPLEGSGGAE